MKFEPEVFLPVICWLKENNISGAQIIDARLIDKVSINPECTQLLFFVHEIVDKQSFVKMLLKRFPNKHETFIFSSNKLQTLSVEKLCEGVFPKDAVCMIPGIVREYPYGFDGLKWIVKKLLGPDGCPWDKEQTHESLKKHMIEETYEVLEAIDRGDATLLCEELGDFVLQAFMHAEMDALNDLYDIDDVFESINKKLIRRHPHVFGDTQAVSAHEVLNNWDEIKQNESENKKSILSGIPKSLPALLRAFEISKRAARIGFDWQTRESLEEKIIEEQQELQQAVKQDNKQRMEYEFGDLLFAYVNLARWLGIEPENALTMMLNRFTERFESMEKQAQKPLRELAFDEWDALWNKAKNQTGNSL